MCSGFGAIVTRNELYFIEPDTNGDVSHNDILRRLSIATPTYSTNLFTRPYVRVECADNTIESFEFDEVDSLPGWVDEQAIRDRVEKVLERYVPLWKQFCRTSDWLWDHLQDRLAKLTALYIQDVQHVNSGQVKLVNTGSARDIKMVRLWDRHDRERQQAWDDYKNKYRMFLREFLHELSKIKGYVPPTDYEPDSCIPF